MIITACSLRGDVREINTVWCLTRVRVALHDMRVEDALACVSLGSGETTVDSDWIVHV